MILIFVFKSYSLLASKNFPTKIVLIFRVLIKLFKIYIVVIPWFASNFLCIFFSGNLELAYVVISNKLNTMNKNQETILYWHDPSKCV